MSATNVLDHGHVRLVSFMQPVPELFENYPPTRVSLVQPQGWTGDLEIVRNARVSYDADWRAGESEKSDEKLLGYMYRNHHTSPFEAMVLTFEVKLPIFVARQWMRHRTWSYNEVSARYAELPEEFYIPKPALVGTQSKHNKQVRDIAGGSFTAEDVEFCDMLQQHSEEGFARYRAALKLGKPRELARCFLGLNTYTRYFGTVDLHNLIHFIRLRLHPHAQWEIQQYAQAMLDDIKRVCPVTHQLVVEELEKPDPEDRISHLELGLKVAMEALDGHLGDTDLDHYETEQEWREENPVAWAHAQLKAALG